MSFSLKMDQSQAATTFEKISDSINNQSQSGNHLYLKVDFEKGSISFTCKKIYATSFNRISKLVDSILQDEKISLSVKNKILKSYQIIANKFNEKKLNFFTRQIHNIQYIFNAIVYFLSGNRNYQICNSQDIILRAKEQIYLQQEREMLPQDLMNIVNQYLETDDRQEMIKIAISRFVMFHDYEGLARRFDSSKVEFSKIPEEIRDLVFEKVSPYMKNIDMRGILLTKAIFEKFKAVEILTVNLYNDDLLPPITTLMKLYIHHDKDTIKRMMEIYPRDSEENIISKLETIPPLYNQFSKILAVFFKHMHKYTHRRFSHETRGFLKIWVGKRR